MKEESRRQVTKKRRCVNGSSAQSGATWEGLDPPLLALKVKEKSHETGSASGLQRLKKARKQICTLY